MSSRGRPTAPSLERRAAMHAALGEPVRLAIVDDLTVSDRSPSEIGARHGLPTNLVAHHLDVLEGAGIVTRSVSSGDGRRKYVQLVPDALDGVHRPTIAVAGPVLFLCSRNSARSQLAAALWTARTGRRADSAGTHPAPEVHRAAVAAASRAGLDLSGAVPKVVTRIPRGTQVVTVCDRAHEELEADPTWWHWSLPDPVEAGDARSFDRTIAELDRRMAILGVEVSA